MTLRDWWYGLLEPVAGPLERFSPDAISVVGLVFGIAAGVAYGFSGLHPALFLVGAILAVLSGVADAFDGIVARRTGRVSAAGDFLDHVFDRVVDISLLGGLALSAAATTTVGLGALVLVLLNGYLGTQIVASFGRRDYSGLGKGQMWILLVAVSLLLAWRPDLGVTVAGVRVGVLDLFFGVIGLGALVAVGGRVRLGLALARSRGEIR